MPPIKTYHENRPWGEFFEFTRNTLSTVKIIVVKQNESFSLQTHEKRDEFWRVISGNGVIQIGEESVVATVGSEFYIPRGTKHRATCSDQSLTLLEIAFGDFDENDIIRLEDRYGRV